MNRFLSIFAITLALPMVAACTATTDGVIITPPPPPPAGSYEKLDSTAAVTSTLGGVELRGPANNPLSAFIGPTSGTMTHNTGATTINGQYSLTDNNGANAAGVMTDGVSVLTIDDKGGYDYVMRYVQTYPLAGTDHVSVGIAGVMTKASDIPTSGSATYSGGADAAYRTTYGDDVTLSDGTSTVVANFASGKVDVTMTGFTPTYNGTPENGPNADIATISISDMTISGNGFSGGDVHTYNSNGQEYWIAGLPHVSNTTNKGAFFGHDSATSTPDEVGGAFRNYGVTGMVKGTYIAD